MFVLQPLFGKLLLPYLGGSPAVWNTCMVFYQAVLFFAYLYAHLVSTRLKILHQILLHSGLIIFSLLSLPLTLGENLQPPTESNPTFWLIATLSIAIGMPFFIVSTTSPLLQRWFSHIGHNASTDPYFLYVASNLGSMIALLSYPFLIEPQISLAEQKSYWSLFYVCLISLVIVNGFLLWKSQKTNNETEEILEAEEATQPLPVKTLLYWLALSFVPSSLLLGLTNFISTDIASAPLLWIIPLTLYLLTFILVFSKWAQYIHPIMVKIQPMILLPFFAFSFIDPAAISFNLNLLLHLLAFFLAVMVCHGELAKSRPEPRHLTHFYLTMSFGGMLGGMFNTFVAPFIFNAVYEYPIMIIAALLLRPASEKIRPNVSSVFPLALLVSGIIYYLITDNLSQSLIYALTNSLILLAGFSYTYRNNPLNLALISSLILIFTLSIQNILSNAIFQQRSFFGVLSVRTNILKNEKNQPERYHELFHGTTKHGAQRLVSPFQTTPLTYYSQPGPMGQLFKTFESKSQHWNIGAVGLGAGALACYQTGQQNWTFYEIDPLVIEVAKDDRYFSYLKRCTPSATFVVGDARLSLKHEPDQKFDLLIMDAFSSDSIPTHLLTQEAIKLYFAKLKPNGILTFHITNRHLKLKKVIADHAQQLKLATLIQEFKPGNNIPLVVATDWVAMAKHEKTLAPLRESRLGNWHKPPLYFDMKPWTDDFSNIIGIWK